MVFFCFLGTATLRSMRAPVQLAAASSSNQAEEKTEKNGSERSEKEEYLEREQDQHLLRARTCRRLQAVPIDHHYAAASMPPATRGAAAHARPILI